MSSRRSAPAADAQEDSVRPVKAVRPFANALFFPAATLYAAVMIPWWALWMSGVVWAPPGLQNAAFHAHEMIFGFALAVVAGYLLGPQDMRFNLMLLGIWLLARLTFLLWPASWLSSFGAALFALGFALRVVPRFARSARKWRNRAIVPLVIGLALLCAAAGPVLRYLDAEAARTLMFETVLFLSCLMYFMGGRIIAPAVAGHLRKAGRPLETVVQPALEGMTLVCFAATLLLVPLTAWHSLTGGLALTIGSLILIRLLRWRPWLCYNRPDLLALLAGYAWLGVGLILLGLAWATAWISAQLSIHAITVGALGTLTLTVMIRTRVLYRFRDANHFPIFILAPVLISLAALARLLAGIVPAALGYQAAVTVAAVCWAGACLLALGVLLKTNIVHGTSGDLTIG